MNIFLRVPPARAGATVAEMRRQKPGIGVIAGFTWKELIVAMLLAIMVLEFIHY